MRVWLFASVLAALFAAAASRFPVNDSDLFWHLATAEWMVSNRALAVADTFSWTIAGQAVPQHQWLGQLLLYGAYALGSWWGVVVLRTLLVFAIAAVVLRGALMAAPRPWIGALVAFPALALSRFVWADRPELVGLLCFVVFVSLALAARDGDRGARVGLLVLMALWPNLHGGFVVGVALLCALAVEAALFDPQRRVAFVAWVALAIAATLLNPYGIGVYDSPGWHFFNPPRRIQEWGLPDVATLPGMLFSVSLLGTLVVAILARGAQPRWLAILVPLSFLSLSAARHMPLFALGAVPYLAAALPEALERVRIRIAAPTGRSVTAVASAALAAATLTASIATAPRDADVRGFPLAAAQALSTEDGRLLNDYDWGGFLIWFARGDPVFIDGRLRPYVGDVLDDYSAIVDLRPEWRAVLERRGIALALVRPSGALAVRLREEGWRTLAVGDDAVLLRRP